MPKKSIESETGTVDAARIARCAWETCRQKFPEISSIDALLCTRKALAEVCRLTALKLGRQIDHDEICRAMLNARKRGDLK